MNLTPVYADLPPLTLTLAVVLVLACMVTDLSRRRIPNLFTFPAVALGMGLSLWGHGWDGLLTSVYGLLAGVALMIIPYYVGGMGGGDVKLMAALGALLGFPTIGQVFLYTAIVGGVMALIVALCRRTLRRTLRNIGAWTHALILMRLGGLSGGVSESELAKSGGSIPYAIAIAVGLIAHMVLGDLI